MRDEYDVDVPALRVKLFREGRLVASVPCESADDATEVAAQYEEEPGVVCEVEDLSTAHGRDDVLAPEPADLDVDLEYRRDDHHAS
jgi:hypothetical protein